MDGGCFCGAIRYRIEGQPRRATHCHCIHCRKTSGAAFVTWAECDLAQFTVLQGKPRHCQTRPGVTRQFCGDCGTPLTFQNAEASREIDVTAASLDAPEQIAPDDHVWCDRMLPWVRMADDLPRFPLTRAAGTHR